MADFMIRFLICNLFICALVGILLAARHLLRNILSGRMQYHLWFLLLGLLTVPFLPFRLTGFPMLLARLLAFCNPALYRKHCKSRRCDDSCRRFGLAE